VLGFSLIFDGGSFLIAIKEFNKARGELSFWKAIIQSKDPSSFLVLFEDGAAVLGLFIVFILMVLNDACNMPALDGVASILVGLLLVFASVILARESRSLLMGEGIAPETQKKIKALAEKDPSVLKVGSILSTYEAPEEVVLMLIVYFKPDLDTDEITDAIERVRKAIKEEFTRIEFVIIQPQGYAVSDNSKQNKQN
jgi:divalent metal cation (Fe/Co/Zn/Cd) transporter